MAGLHFAVRHSSRSLLLPALWQEVTGGGRANLAAQCFGKGLTELLPSATAFAARGQTLPGADGRAGAEQAGVLEVSSLSLCSIQLLD